MYPEESRSRRSTIPTIIRPESSSYNLHQEATLEAGRSLRLDSRLLQTANSEHETHDFSNASTPTLEKGVYHYGTDPKSGRRPQLSLRQRILHFTWAWYTLPMSTGGLSMLLYCQPHQFPGLKPIGLAAYITNILIFAAVTAAMCTRFLLHSGSFRKSITHPREGFFVPTFFLSLATLVTSTDRYAIPKHDSNLIWAVQGSFWAYLVATLLLAIGQYSYVFASHNLNLQTMMPTWILPIFPIMLSGTIASVIAETQPDIAAVPIIVAGLTCQGLGLSVAVVMYAHMVGRLMQAGLPCREHRPGLFMNVGPPAFTALALIGMARGLPADLVLVGNGSVVDVGVVRVVAVMSAVFLWALSLWWFGIAAIAVVQAPPRYFHLSWWAMVFPNTGFTLATISIASDIGSDVVGWVATAMSIVVIVMFAFVSFHHARAVIVQDIMCPGRDEDVEDH
jgi:C4-dicarboxylate transporter/malic acid transport protein